MYRPWVEALDEVSKNTVNLQSDIAVLRDETKERDTRIEALGEEITQCKTHIEKLRPLEIVWGLEHGVPEAEIGTLPPGRSPSGSRFASAIPNCTGI